MARTTPRTFSLAERFTFEDAISYFMFRNGTVTNQDITTYFNYVDKIPISKQGLFKALNKVNPAVFPAILRLFAEKFYENDYEKLKGYMVIAADGTFYDLPPAREMRERYGGYMTPKITVDQIRKPQAKGSILYDVINHLIIDACIAPYRTSELPLLYQHMENCKSLLRDKKVLLLADRYYGSAELFLYCMLHNIKFCIRGKKYFYKDYVNSVERDGMIEIPFDKAWIRRLKREECKEYAKKVGKLKLRVVKNTFTYREGKIEKSVDSIYFTNLEAEEFSFDEIVSLYHTQRWEVETAYSTLKSHLEIERFNSAKYNIVTNEIYGKMLCYNISGLFYKASETEIELQNKSKKKKYSYLPNMKYIVDTLRREKNLIRMFAKSKIRQRKNKKWDSYLQELIRRFSREKVPVRPKRHVKRWGRWVSSPLPAKFRLDGRRNPIYKKCYKIPGYVSCSH